MPWLAHQLQITLTRRDKLGGPYRDGGRTSERPLAYNAEASDAAWVLRDTLRVWTEELSTHIGIAFAPVWTHHRAEFIGPLRPGEKRLPTSYRPTAVDYAGWLAHHIARLQQLPDAARLQDEIAYACRAAAFTVDRREGAVFAGPCPCGVGGLFGRRDSDRLHCRSCGAKVARRENDVRVYEQLGQRFLPASDMVIAVQAALGVAVSRKRIHDLSYRRHNPVRRVTDTTGRKLYSAADVLAALGGHRFATAA
ncbi:hypothetical protein [Nocardia brasiliensis]|uniref:hypothetical protein n=1 Tax=Nocardia brasiliensis TaxID=37326 RepID=UPI001EEBA564|nr:hypothetical protein [Nocardia brasiliensis]